MALSSKITDIYIKGNNASGEYDYTIKSTDFSVSLGQVNFTSAYDEAIDGSLRSNIRGFRLDVTLDFPKILSNMISIDLVATGNEIGDLFTDMIDSFVTQGDSFIQISFNGSDYHNVIPDSASFTTAYRNQIGRGSASLKLIGQQILTSIPDTLQAPSV